jgi:histidinol-phosphatase (PHP family)
MIDYHLHTKLCKHASGTVSEFIEQAIKLGITEIAFTDHIPMPDLFDPEHRMTFEEMEVYQIWIETARRTYPEITIRFGIEADYYKGYESFIQSFLQKFDFDLVIMSVHFIRHWPKGNWVFDYDFAEKPIELIYSDYIKVLSQGVHTGLFDVVGHVDMIKKPGHSLLKIIPEHISEFLDAIQRSGMVVEINSSGYRKETQESYPGYDWLSELARREIPICTGSDAHKPEQVGLQFESMYRHLKNEKQIRFARFDHRKLILQPFIEMLEKNGF